MSSTTTPTGANAPGTGLKPAVAMSIDFLSRAARLPAAIHAKVLKWAMAFQNDPTSPGINYETIHARDPNLRSVRIDDDWRGIVHKPPKGNVYTLLYVDRHDDAYAWAKSRKVAINRVTGAMQLVLLEQAPSSAEPRVAGSDEHNHPVHDQHPREVGFAGPSDAGRAIAGCVEPWAPFTDLADEQLLALGVPEDWLGRVRAVDSEVALDALQPSLPIEAYEGLFLVGSGDSVDSVLAARETRVDRQIDIDDFEAALKTPESQSRFVLVSDDAALSSMLNAPLAQWRVFLHPTQTKLAQGHRSGPVRVLGGAGTGKTVLAMHRAKWLAEHVLRPGEKVLFTTFTRNLARDIEDNLRSLCAPATMERIEVRNLDAWVLGALRARRYPHRIVYDRESDPAARAAWAAAMAVRDTTLELPDDFYEQELEGVVLVQGVTTRDEYRAARRAGRGVVLSRAKRDVIWPVFEEYRRQMATRQLKDVDDAYREVASVLEREAAEARSREADWPGVYRSIVIDETQDFGPQALTLLRAMVPRRPDDLFFVGDGHQRIYPRNRAAMSRCGIDIRGRSRKLYLNYRTTAEIRNQAVALLEGVEVDDLDDSHDELRRYKSLSHGPKPKVHTVAGLESAIDQAVEAITFWQTTDRTDEQGTAYIPTVAVLARSSKVRDEIGRRCSAAGLEVIVIDKEQVAHARPGLVHLATLHRAKGLEFDRVVVVAPAESLGATDETAQERCLLYVALTRARREAWLVLF